MIIRKITAMILVAFCSGCVNSDGASTNQGSDAKASKELSSKLDRIESALERGDKEMACNLQVLLSKDLINYKDISPKMLSQIRKVELNCGASRMSIDF